MKENDWFWLTKMETVREGLIRNGIGTYVVMNGEEARNKVLSLISAGSSVGLGGSRTVVEIGLLDALRSGDYKLYDQYDPKIGKEEELEVRKKGTQAEYFVSGSNAITETGQIVNTDGLGNRLAAFCFGPEKVIIVAGRNKIVKDVEAAIDRVKNVAAPMNARRFGIDTPCAKTGECADCSSPQRICNLTLIIEKQRVKGRMIVILINEELGF